MTTYCPQCKKCFISYNKYINYRRRYGALLGNIKIANSSFVTSETELAEESILHICGYSVNQSDNLSKTERHAILQYLIDSKVSSKPEIISYLDFFIHRNGKKQNMDEAVRRWTEDINWVRDYQINRQNHYKIANIQKNRYPLLSPPYSRRGGKGGWRCGAFIAWLGVRNYYINLY